MLIPPELSLVLEPEMMDKHEQPQVRVWTRVSVAQGRRWSPFQGTVRLGALPASSADINEVGHLIFLTVYFLSSFNQQLIIIRDLLLEKKKTFFHEERYFSFGGDV